jgi:hypothetical protein
LQANRAFYDNIEGLGDATLVEDRVVGLMPLNGAAGRQPRKKSVIEGRQNRTVPEFLGSAQDKLYLTPRSVWTLRHFDLEMDRFGG